MLRALTPRIGALGVVGLVGASLALLLTARGQEPKSREAPAIPSVGPNVTRQYFSYNSCAPCHKMSAQAYLESRTPKDRKDAPKTLICLMTEIPTWEGEDKHSLAYKVLEGERGRRMGQLLYGDPDVTNKPDCLSCHAATVGPDVEAGRVASDGEWKASEGVTCVICHGPYKSWVGEHINFLATNWRDLSREQKQFQHGMIDLWDPAIRAHTCVSCHVGNKAEGKFLTHQMYAAGHPPLPGFEVAVFSDQEPRHWSYLREKNPVIQKLQGFDAKERERAKLLVIGQVVAFREALALLADDARDKAAEPNAEDQALDITHFDCYACHHDLKIPGWRQKRGYVGSAGRPQPRPWPTALIRLALRADAPDEASYRKISEEFAGHLKNYRQPFEDRPFGDPVAVETPTRAFVDWLDALTARLKAKPFDVATCKTLLREIGDTALGETPDFDSARQLAWAFDVLWSELDPPPQAPQADEILKTVRSEMRLNLPAGTKEFILNDLPANLDAVALYDPKVFQSRMASLVRLIPAE